MKKIFAISILAAAAAMMISCDKNELQQSFAGSSDSFYGSIDNVMTKTTLTADDKINWEAGDEIDINGTTFVATPDASNAAKAVFDKKSGSDPALVSGKYNAYYPASLVVDGVPTLPAVQTYSATSIAGVNPMYAQSADQNLSFKNICGLLEISLKGNKTITSIEVSSDNLGMSGAFTVDADNNAVVTGDAPVVLDCGSGVKLKAGSAAKFYIAIPAGTYENLTIFVTTADDYYAAVTAEEAVVKRNTIYAVAPSLEFISGAYLAFVGDYAYPMYPYDFDAEEFDTSETQVGYMEVYAEEVNKSFAIFFPEATPEYEGEYYDYFIANFDSRSKSMVLTNGAFSEQGAIWGFTGLDGYYQMSAYFEYLSDYKNTITSLTFTSDEDGNLTLSTSPASTDEEGDIVGFIPSIYAEDGTDSGYVYNYFAILSDTFYNFNNLTTSEAKAALKFIASHQPIVNRDFTLKTPKSIERGTGAYLMK